MKRQDKFGDPLKLFKKNNLNIDERIGKRTFYLPTCKFTAPTNRFKIEPGYKWDGVDRSNGFEKRYLQAINMRKDREERFYSIRTEEM